MVIGNNPMGFMKGDYTNGPFTIDTFGIRLSYISVGIFVVITTVIIMAVLFRFKQKQNIVKVQ